MINGFCIEIKKKLFIENKLFLYFKGTVNVVLSDPPLIECYLRFTIV